MAFSLYKSNFVIVLVVARAVEGIIDLFKKFSLGVAKTFGLQCVCWGGGLRAMMKVS